jgi:hypothetical protein
MEDELEQLTSLNEQLEAGLYLVEEKQAAIREYLEKSNTYKQAKSFIGNVLKHYQAASNIEGLNQKSAPLFIAQLFFDHIEGIVAGYNDLAKKIGKKLSLGNGLEIGKEYFQTLAPVIEKAYKRIGGYLLAFYDETKELLGGSKLFNDMEAEYKGLKIG